jgi:hypothetical protein
MEAIIWAMKARGLTPTAWKLLLKLCDRVNNERDDFDVWPSQKTIADDCEVSVATVKRHLQELVDEGYIRVIGQFDARSGSKTVNRYRIQVRTRAVMPKEFIAVEPQGPAGPQAQYDPGHGAAVSRPIAQSELGDGVTGELTEPTESRTYPSEPTPLSLTGEEPPRDLLNDLDTTTSTALATTRPSIIEHVKQGWEALTERYTRIPTVRAWSDSRKKAIARRADEVVRASAGALDAYQVWDQIFSAIAGDQWLRGESDPGKGYDRAYVVEIDHVLRTGGTPNFLWILERATTNDRDNRLTNDPSSGRRLGPAEQATHAALARLRAAGERRA